MSSIEKTQETAKEVLKLLEGVSVDQAKFILDIVQQSLSTNSVVKVTA